MRILTLTAISLSALAFSSPTLAQSYNGYSAHEACKKSENKNKLLGGGIGAVAGAVIGSQISGSGARTEGSAIGGVLGGLAGAGIADKRIDCDPVYTQREQPVYYPSQPASTTSYPSTTYSTTSYQTATSQPVYTNSGHATSYQTVPSYHHTSSYTQASSYPVRTTVSDHPIYSNPGYTTSTYHGGSYNSGNSYHTTTTTQPRVVRTYSAQPATTSGGYYSRTSYASPRAHHVQTRPTKHFHGKYQCFTHH
jgi:uncharacterized protein YcfJ